ncbi:MAG: hypothetical protein Q8R47_05965 [Nanoarchaeota archaeon]|nr:hypothetical protein [Nanoarchaeota archaeon]
MDKRWGIFLLLLALLPSALAQGTESFWQKYGWYIIGAGLILLAYLLFKITKKLIILGVVIAIAVIVGKVLLDSDGTSEIGVVGEIHYHADFAVYLDGERYNFAQEKYMSTENKTLSNFAHLHDMDGNIIHKHASGITLGFFLETLGMKLNDTCLALDDGVSYCNEGNKGLKMYVNEKHNDEFHTYDIQDGDKILLSYGDGSGEEIKEQLDSVSDQACIYSLTCPEKGTPPEEAACVGETCTVEG